MPSVCKFSCNRYTRSSRPYNADVGCDRSLILELVEILDHSVEPRRRLFAYAGKRFTHEVARAAGIISQRRWRNAPDPLETEPHLTMSPHARVYGSGFSSRSTSFPNSATC